MLEGKIIRSLIFVGALIWTAWIVWTKRWRMLDLSDWHERGKRTNINNEEMLNKFLISPSFSRQHALAVVR